LKVICNNLFKGILKMIRQIKTSDISEILPIYNYHVKNTIVTFDIIPLSIEQYSKKVERISNEFPFLVYVENNEILGYAYASKWRQKPAYNHTVESTVYTKNIAQGKHIGTKLYLELIKQLKVKDYKTIIGGISLPNEPSIQFHEKFGFKKVGHFSKVGKKFDQWVDVAFWQLNL